MYSDHPLLHRKCRPCGGTHPSITTSDNRDMLKRQRPATPPPSALGDPPSFLPDGPIRPLQPSHTTDPSEPRSKRQRTRPPPLDGALRGWMQTEPAGPHWESDGEEDWTEDVHMSPQLPSSTTTDQYKDANSLLHELHVLNQYRLLFAHLPRDRPLNANPTTPLPTSLAHTQDPPAGQRQTAWTEGLPYRTGLSEGKGLAEEVRCVRQRYEDANRFLGSLFLSRRREVEETAFSIDRGLSS